MNTNEEPSELWKHDELAAERAAMFMTDSTKLEPMVEDILTGRIPYRHGVVRWLCGNQNSPFQVAEKLAPPDYQRELFRRKDATAQAVHSLAETTESLDMIAIIVGHPNSAPATLLKLTKHRNPRAVYHALNSGRLPAPILERFAGSKSADARKAVGRFSQKPKTLAKLAMDLEAKVRLAVAINPRTDDATICTLARNEKRPCPTMCRVVARRLKDPLLLEKIREVSIDWDNKGIIRAFRRNPRCPDGIKVYILLRSQAQFMHR